MSIIFKPLEQKELPGFRTDVKRIFSIAFIETFGEPENEDDIISDDIVNESLLNPLCEAFSIYEGEEKVGGVVLKIDRDTWHNEAEILYIYPEKHGRGLGQKVWRAIEQKYPQTKVWRLITPYFEKRNIHFYVNKCGFRIVEFFNKAHRHPEWTPSALDFHDEFFVFEKIM